MKDIPLHHEQMSDKEIVNEFKMHGLPLIIATDGGYTKGCMMVSKTIVVPDVQD